MSSYALNQFAPTYQAGLEQPPTETVGYEDKPFGGYIYNPPGGELTANQIINPDSVAIETDADFWLAGWYVSVYTGNFQIQLLDSTGYQLQAGMINGLSIAQTPSDPTVFSPAHPFVAGSKVQVVIQDLSGATNPLQIVLVGWKRFRIQKKS